MDRVSEKILADAEKECNRIIKTAEENRERKRDEGREEIKQQREQIEKESNKVEEREYERLTGLKEIESRNDLLEHKHKLMSRLFNEIQDELLSIDRYKKLIISLFENLIEIGSEQVFVGRDEKIIDEKLIERLNREKGWELILSSQRVPIKGGFILERGKVRIDAGIETVLNEKMKLLEPELVKILFNYR